MGDGVLAKMYSQPYLMDVAIKVEGDEREIKAHRSVLVGASDYFHSLFKDKFAEKDSNEIILKEICFDTLQMLVEFVYTGKLSFEKCTVLKAIELSDYLMIDCATKSLNEHISQNISVKNFSEFYGAFEIVTGDVRNQLETFIRKNLIELHRRQDFFALNVDQLKSILSNPCPVERLYDLRAIVEWTKANKGYQYVPQLLPLVVIAAHPSTDYLFSELLPICKCAESKDFCLALLGKATGINNQFIDGYFNDKNWTI